MAARIPNVSLRLGLGYNIDAGESQGFVQVGAPLPIFDRNQGNIASANAELDKANQEVRRLELELRSRLASAFTSYKNSLDMVERYRKEVLPRAQKAYDLYLKRFQQMAAAYPQVLIAQRTLCQSQIQYINALVDLRQSVVIIEGMLLADSLNP
jgi:cobalt-zinc-cadmium efflux system outer membrane protein